MAATTLLLIGTKKGAFLLTGDADRRNWRLSEPLCDGWPIHDVSFDPADRTIYAGGGSPWYGPAIWRSTDIGRSWSHSSAGLSYGAAGPDIATVWNVTPAPAAIYAGVEPAGLFRSEDHGETWQHVEGLTKHPTRPDWQPGNGGLILHSIVADPADPKRAWVGISAVGTFATEDGGATWETRNRGVRAGFIPGPEPEFGQCVHKLVMAADGERLFQQNHCGVYRSADAGRSWQEITGALPSEFGFPMAAHPRDPNTVWVVPLNGADRGRYVPDASAAVWRTRDGGATWDRRGDGLPQRDAYISVLREAMAADRHDPAGVYIGTSTGELYGSADEGETWSLLADHLPPIWSVDAAIVD